MTGWEEQGVARDTHLENNKHPATHLSPLNHTSKHGTVPRPMELGERQRSKTRSVDQCYPQTVAGLSQEKYRDQKNSETSTATR